MNQILAVKNKISSEAFAVLWRRRPAGVLVVNGDQKNRRRDAGATKGRIERAGCPLKATQFN
jgi:hypothetical protein